MAARLMHDSMGRRLRRPYHWTAFAAIFLALVTTLLGVRAGFAVHAASVPLPYEVTVQIKGKQDFNITQEHVDAELAAHPVRSSQPLTLILVDRWLTGDEKLRGEIPDNQIIISSKLDNFETKDTDVEERFSGVALARNLAGSDDAHTDLSYDIEKAFTKNVSVGHGSKAVVAAAHTASVVLDRSATSSVIFWFSVVGLSAMLTAAFLVPALRFRSRWESRHRRLAVAQRKLARVVLDLEALEATYAATEASRRPEGFTSAWMQLQKLSLNAARNEDPLVGALFDREQCLGKETGEKLAAFEATTRKLTGLADSLMGAGSVHARLAGTGSTFDKLSSPINDAATALLIRLEGAPGKMVAGADLAALREALGTLLDAAQGDIEQLDAVQAWSAAEEQLSRIAHRLIRQLRRYPHGKRPPIPEVGAEHNQLRSTLGLAPVSQHGALHQLHVANSVARSILGDTLSADQKQKPNAQQASLPARLLAKLAQARPHGKDEPGKLGRAKIIGLLAVLLCASLIAAGSIVYSVTKKPQATYDGSGQGMFLEFDDKAGLIDEAEIRRYMEEDFEVEQHLLVAVRDAESYLELHNRDGSEYRESTPQSVRQAIWRIKNEYKDRMDPVSQELPENLTIIPLLITDEGKGIMPGLISGAVISGTASWGSTSGWEYGSIYESRYPSMEVAHAAEDFATVLKRAGYEEPDYNATLLFWILTFMFFFTVLNLIQLVQYLLGATSRFNRFSRGSRSLQQARRRLERLALGLDDSQINAVAVLGASESGHADEAGQRLFERALMMAWREAEELSTMSLSERLGSGYAARADHLQRLVALLDERDADVAKRARDLVLASRGAGGDAPQPVVLPGQQ
ncbi:hypothetical protein AOZ07_14865 [Glutamicibacter halophytocola]|uniref:hypothetical protein n=1 Tax=Glutamicibacter halophytocola TaxID=1933880 RepID=UPI0006D4BFE1|nr:hypothetical protein [Glutamicibacter halophytocola]ALG30132.1 hypothetical protein AOZ07_14865 [Glutamicibacter halophytocola]NQD42229.1 hypothetical protein [Glutamicibacter halophytocola]